MLRSRCKRTAGVLLATVLASAGVLAAMAPAGAAPGDVTTVAGNATPTNIIQGSDGLARFGNTLYVSDYSGYVVSLDLTTGIQSVYAGARNVFGYAGDGGPATSALLSNVGALAVDSYGNLYFNENDWNTGVQAVHCHIRRVDATTHVITTYAGSEDPDRRCNSAIGDGGDANDAGFYSIEDMAFDSHDNLYIATRQNNIRRIDRATHVIDTVAGGIWDQGSRQFCPQRVVRDHDASQRRCRRAGFGLGERRGLE